VTKIFGCKDLEDNITTILARVSGAAPMSSAMGVLTETGGTLTTDGTEQTIYLNNSPAGVFKPTLLRIETSAQTATETIVLREYYRSSSGGTLLLYDTATYVGTIADEGIIIHLDPNRFGVKVTIEKTAGTNRDYPWEVFYEV